MHLLRRTVSRHFRELFLEHYPALSRESSYMRLAEHILFGTITDESTGRLLINRQTVARLEDKERQWMQENYSARAFLDRFSRDVAPIEYSDWSYGDRRARVIENRVFSDSIWAARDHEIRKIAPDEGRVYFVTGQCFNPKTQKRYREEDRATALSQLSTAGCVQARQLLGYMNSLRPHRFHKALAHLDEAVQIALGIDREVVCDRQLNILQAIRDQPLPLYKPTDHSVRIFSLNDSIALLKRELRQTLTQDWQGFDLRSAQLAICATDWGVPEVQAFLKARTSIWTELLAWHGEPANSVMKDTLKHALYATMFGAGKDRIRAIFKSDGYDQSIADHFLRQPLIAAMLRARSVRLREINSAAGATNCFGIWTPKTRSARSVLAQLAQARELQLLLPVLELARNTRDFAITLWLHDGFYVDFKDASKARRWTERIASAVNRQAHNLGILTELEPKA